ncbi:hypothetical protein [Marinobacterium sp. BA1]|uniref:hypothetical protein n=1 Tax=Marinobacterium sp. BA1 TaxID=3138931 RepID=UPI0032E61F13
MSIEELIEAARASAHEPATSAEVLLFAEVIDKKHEEFEAEVRAQASEDAFMARTYTL